MWLISKWINIRSTAFPIFGVPQYILPEMAFGNITKSKNSCGIIVEAMPEKGYYSWQILDLKLAYLNTLRLTDFNC